jgi:predicted RNA-binding protein YlxR (DUF448 family)
VVTPVRTCIGCRERAPKGALVRLVWRDGVMVDERQTAPGRGAYLHRSRACLDKAVKRRALARALRVPGVDPVALSEAVGPSVESGSQPPVSATSRNHAPVA